MQRHIIQFEQDGVIVRKEVTESIYTMVIKLINNPGFCAFVEDLEKEQAIHEVDIDFEDE
jgi:hypothetical protein